MTQVMQTTDTARQFSCTHAEHFRHELHDLLRIPSISVDPTYAHDVQRAAEWLSTQLGLNLLASKSTEHW